MRSAYEAAHGVHMSVPIVIEHGTSAHLMLLGVPMNLHHLTGSDCADVLAFGRACMAAERERCIADAADEEFLAAVKTYIEEVEVKIEGEWGSGLPLTDLIAEDRMPMLYAEVLKRIAVAAGLSAA